MKNLVQGQEISKYNYNGLIKLAFQDNIFGFFAGGILILGYPAYFLGLPIMGLGFFANWVGELDLSLPGPLKLVPLFIYLVLLGFFWYLSYKKLTRNKSFNPSVVYYDDCLLVLLNPDKDGFKGEIPFKKIRRVVLLRQNIIQLIVEEDFFPIINLIDKKPEFYFQLRPELRKAGLQIVDELNSKLK